MTVNGALLTKILLLLLGALFMAMSLAKGLAVRGALSKSREPPRMPPIASSFFSSGSRHSSKGFGSYFNDFKVTSPVA